MSKAHSATKRPFLRTQNPRSRDFSAQKRGTDANSPQSDKIFEGEYGNIVIFGRAKAYREVFQTLPVEFWLRMTALREELRDAVRKGRAAGISGSGWTYSEKSRRVSEAIHGKPPSNSYFSAELAAGPGFLDAFLEAITDSAFPERPKARARFLAESLAGYGEVGARRCRDICSDMRKDEKRRKISHPELWIKCCGRSRWTVNSLCPECGRSPISIVAIF